MTLVGPKDNIVVLLEVEVVVAGQEVPQTDSGDMEGKPEVVAVVAACNHNLEITAGRAPDEQTGPAVVASQIQLLHQQSYLLLGTGQ